MGGSSVDISEVPMAYVKRWKGWRMSYDVGEDREGLENELWRRWSEGRVGEWGSAEPGISLTSPGKPPIHGTF